MDLESRAFSSEEEKIIARYEIEIERIQNQLEALLIKHIKSERHQRLQELIEAEKRKGRIAGINLEGEGLDIFYAKTRELEAKKNDPEYQKNIVSEAQKQARELAQEITAEIYEIVLSIDENLNELFKDARVAEKYDYDGVAFKAKDGTQGIFFALDGLHVLSSLENSYLESFFSHQKKTKTEDIKPHLFLWFDFEKHFLVARARLLNWEENRSVALVSREKLEKLFEQHKEILAEQLKRRIEPAPMTTSEQNFFSLYEAEMGVPDGELDEWLNKKIGEGKRGQK